MGLGGASLGAIVGGAVGTAVTVVAAPFVLPALGFGAAGVVTGTVAAGAQSWLYGGLTGGAFAALQSAGVLGVGAAGAAGGGGVAATIGGVIGGIISGPV